MSNDILRKVPIFADLSERALEVLAEGSRTRSYPAGQILWTEGDPGESLMILETGQIRVSRMTAGGQEVVLAVLDPPAYLGELALIDGAPRDATTIAQRAATVRLIPRAAFFALLESEPSLQLSLIHSLVRMVRAANARHALVVGLDVPGRLAAWLLTRITSESGVEVVSMAGRSQAELAAELSTTRSTLNRALRELEALGIIHASESEITVLDSQALAGFTT